ncbi:MAG TPA: CHASE domain-containing protein [Pyrinomonadaceae bacterium]|jgi:PAS domain S-box-containing protein
MKSGSPPTNGQPRRAWVPYFVLAVALLLTLLAAYYVFHTAEARDRLQFQNSVQHAQTSIQNRLETYISGLRAGSALFAASDEVSRDEFSVYVQRLDFPHRFPGIRGIGFSVRVKPEEIDALVAKMHREGFNDFRIWPEGARSEYHTIIYLEPRDRRNMAAIGYDMFTQPVRRDAMERARDTGQPATTGRVVLIQEVDSEKQAGFLIYVPVYRKGLPTGTAAEREAALEGFVYSPFRASDFFEGILGPESYTGIDWQVYDGQEMTEEHLLHRSSTPNALAHPPRFAATTNMDVAGRTWSIAYSTRPEFERASGAHLVWFILPGGLLISFVLFGVTWSLAHARAAAERSAADLLQSEKAISFQAHLLDTVEQAVIATDLDGVITYWNRFAETLYGWSAAEATGRNIIEVTPAKGSLEQASEIMSRLRKGESWSGEMLVRRRDGTDFPAMVTDSPILDRAGNLIGVVGVSIDITERKRAEAALREADQRAITEYERLLVRLASLGQALGTARDLITIFRALRDFAVASVPCIGIFISLYDPQRDVRTAAYGWGDGIEFDVSGLPPMPISTEGPNSRAVKTGQIIITDDYTSATRGHPSVVVGPDNGLRPQSSLAAPMAVMGRIVGTIEVQSYERSAYREEHVAAMRMAANLAAVAIENVQLFERESRARAAAEESNRMKDEFLATVSHELRTPLTSILGWARMLSSGTLDEATSLRAVETIERNAKSQSQIIEDILDVSRIITGKLSISVEPVELVTVIESAINAVRPAVEAKGIQVETAFDAGAHRVSGDANRLQQVVWNLLSNAVKFTPHGGRMQVRLRQTGTEVEIIVHDTGQGINKEFLPYVFDRFRQADSSTTRQHGGLGLGLAIVRHLVELHGGRVYAESDGEGEGTTFTVRLPLAGMQGLPHDGAAATPAASAPDTFACEPSLAGLRVLVVDDEADTLELVKMILERCSVEVTTATSTREALARLEAAQPDVLISDIGMPVEDGYQLIRKVRALAPERGGNIPAIALTAYAGEADRRAALSSGYQTHLAKPIEPSEVLRALANLVRSEEEVRLTTE